MNTFNIVTPTKGCPSFLSFRDEIISIYFGEHCSKVDTNIIECCKSRLWACKTYFSLDMCKDFNIAKCDYTKGYDKFYLHIKNH